MQQKGEGRKNATIGPFEARLFLMHPPPKLTRRFVTQLQLMVRCITMHGHDATRGITIIRYDGSTSCTRHHHQVCRGYRNTLCPPAAMARCQLGGANLTDEPPRVVNQGALDQRSSQTKDWPLVHRHLQRRPQGGFGVDNGLDCVHCGLLSRAAWLSAQPLVNEIRPRWSLLGLSPLRHEQTKTTIQSIV